MNYKVLSLKDKNEWNAQLKRLPLIYQDIYYLPEYYSLYEEYGDGKAACFIFESKGETAMYPFLMNSVNDLGYQLEGDYFDIQGAYGYNGVAFTSADPVFAGDFHDAFSDYCQSSGIIAEFTRFHPLLRNELFSKDHMQVVFDRRTMYLDLTADYDAIVRNYQATTRKQIRRAVNRYNLSVIITKNDTSVLDHFLPIYHEAMDRAGSVPYLYFNRQYFSSLIVNTPNICLTAFHEGKPVASILAFLTGCFIHGHLGGTLTEYLDMSAFSLLYDEMIRYGKSHGCRYLHVGGGNSDHPGDPLLKFKLNFSQTTADFHIGKKIHNKSVYDDVAGQWEKKYPEKKEKFGKLLLKYRY